MSSNKLALAELERFDWSQFRCGCGGTAGHVPDIFRTILDAVEPEEAMNVVLDGHLEVEGNLFEVAVPAIGVILAALSGEVTPFARSQLVTELWRLVDGDSHHTEVALGRTNLGDECNQKAREGIWVILKEGFGKHGDLVIDILESIELDSGRLSYYRGLLKGPKRKKRNP